MFRTIYKRCSILVALHLLPGLVFAAAADRRQPVQFGVDTYLGIYHLGTEIGNSMKPAAVDRTNYLDAVRDLGATTIRENIMLWSLIQPEKDGPYHFDVMDDLVRKASERGIHILGLAYFFPPWATVGEDRPWNYSHGQDGRYRLPMRQYEPEFKKFLRTTVSRYCGCQADSLKLKTPVREWLFMNEPEGYADMFLKADEYAHWLRIFDEQIKSVDPGAVVVAPALAVPGLWHGARFTGKFLDDLLSSKELQGPHFPYFDVEDFHPYPTFMGPPKPDIYAANISDYYVQDVLQAHHLKLPLWVTEIGDNPADLITQADHEVEYLVHAASVGVSRVYILGLWDFGVQLYGHPWGLLEDTPSGQVPVRKPSFIACQTLFQRVKDNRGVDFLGPGRYRIPRANQGPLYILWAQDEYTMVPRFLYGRLRVTDLQDHTQEMDTEKLRLSEHPVLVEMLDKTLE